MVSFILFSDQSLARLFSFREECGWALPVSSPFFIKVPGVAERGTVWRDGVTQPHSKGIQATQTVREIMFRNATITFLFMPVCS